MPATAPAPAKKGDRHKKRHNIGLRPTVFEIIGKAAKRSSRPVSWEVELAIAYYAEHCLGMAIPDSIRRLVDSHDE